MQSSEIDNRVVASPVKFLLVGDEVLFISDEICEEAWVAYAWELIVSFTH